MLLKFDPLMTKTVARHKPDSRLMASRVNAALSTPSIAAFMVQIEFTAPAYQFELVMSENILSPSAERTTLRKVTPNVVRKTTSSENHTESRAMIHLGLKNT